MNQTAVEQLIERIQLEYDAAEKEYLKNKSRESYIALRCFQLCRTFAKEALEIEAKQRQEDTNHGYSQGYDDGAEGAEPMKPEIKN